MIWNENMENMEHYKIEWKCGRCGKIYDTNQLISLEKIKLVESDNDPTSQHGFTPVCECGYIFLYLYVLHRFQGILLQFHNIHLYHSAFYCLVPEKQ